MPKDCKGLLSGRVALVTGGASGIGRATCIAFAREGARVVIVDINLSGLEETRKLMHDSDKHVTKLVDVSKSFSVNQLFKEIKEMNFGVPDILVNCAGTIRMFSLLETTEEMYDVVMGVNMKGTFLMTQAAAKYMIEAKVRNGSIVNISSVCAKSGYVCQAVYSATKAGVDGFSKVVAKELGQYGIRCNTIRPGLIDTPLAASSLTDEKKQEIINTTPLGRIGQPEDIAETCVFLASTKSSFATGSRFQVSGGLLI